MTILDRIQNFLAPHKYIQGDCLNTADIYCEFIDDNTTLIDALRHYLVGVEVYNFCVDRFLTPSYETEAVVLTWNDGIKDDIWMFYIENGTFSDECMGDEEE